VEESRVVAGDTTLAITVSIGLYVSEDMTDLHHAIARGDAALYEAKRTGRNRVHRAQHDEAACG
jgi:PleD family two-component response regulator